MMDRTEKEKRGAELLPFYVNGTLSPDERAEVEALLANDDGLRRQEQVLRRVRAAIKADEPAYSPGERGLARLMRAIGPTERRWWQSGRIAAAVAASMAAAVAIGVVIGQSMGERVPVYEQAGATVADRLLIVAFRPTAAQGDISDLLLDLEATIVDGPSAIGLYRVSVPEARAMDAVIAALRAASTLVESADVEE